MINNDDWTKSKAPCLRPLVLIVPIFILIALLYGHSSVFGQTEISGDETDTNTLESMSILDLELEMAEERVKEKMKGWRQEQSRLADELLRPAGEAGKRVVAPHRAPVPVKDKEKRVVTFDPLRDTEEKEEERIETASWRVRDQGKLPPPVPTPKTPKPIRPHVAAPEKLVPSETERVPKNAYELETLGEPEREIAVDTARQLTETSHQPPISPTAEKTTPKAEEIFKKWQAEDAVREKNKEEHG